MATRQRRPTLKSIADEVGVSPTTVSYALNGKGAISEQTRQRIIQVAREMKYVFSAVEESETSPRVLGILYPDRVPCPPSVAGNSIHQIYSKFAQGIQSELARLRGYTATYAPNVRDNFIACGIPPNDLAGLIFFGYDADNDMVGWAAQRGIPVVLLNHAGTFGVSSVSVANRRATSCLVDHLIVEHGYRRFAFVQRSPVLSYTRARLEGCIDAMRGHGLTQKSLSVHTIGYETVKVVDDLMSRLPQLDAIVADRDWYAVQLIAELGQRGVSVPQDVAVVGFDNLGRSLESEPTLTTVGFDSVDIGKKAVRILDSINRGEVLEAHVEVPYVLVLRSSCGCMSVGRR